MEKFIPYEKLSKKKKRELDAHRRTLWAISPVTRRSENPKAYNRKKARKRMDDPASVLSLFYETMNGSARQFPLSRLKLALGGVDRRFPSAPSHSRPG